jgi:hypothetical protein
MPEFFVWSVPSAFQKVEAESEQDAAEMFVGQELTPIPTLNALPVCFVQLIDGQIAPSEEAATEFWVDLLVPT